MDVNVVQYYNIANIIIFLIYNFNKISRNIRQ